MPLYITELANFEMYFHNTLQPNQSAAPIKDFDAVNLSGSAAKITRHQNSQARSADYNSGELATAHHQTPE